MTAAQLATFAGLLADRTLTRGWIVRVGSSRAVRVTPAGTSALTALLGPDPAWN